mgnify:CR=1 FL=1
MFRAVNRLDRDTSGLVLLAKNPYSSCVLSDAVKDHTIHREYAAIVSGKTDASGTIDLPIAEDLHLNGKARLHLRLQSSTNKGLLSAQLMELGSKKYLQPYPAVLSVRTLDNGRYHMLDNLTELPFKEASQRVISKGYLNLQNRHDLLEIETVTPGEWMEFDFDLQPTIYKLEKGATLRLVLYTTDFEITVRDQTDYQLTIDLAQSSLHLPEMTETR